MPLQPINKAGTRPWTFAVVAPQGECQGEIWGSEWSRLASLTLPKDATLRLGRASWEDPSSFCRPEL